MASKRCDRDAVAPLGLEPYARRVGSGVKDLIAEAVFRCTSDSDRNGDAWRRPTVRFREKMAANRRAQSLRDAAGSARRGSQQGDQLVSARMSNQLTLAQIGPRQVENG